MNGRSTWLNPISLLTCARRAVSGTIPLLAIPFGLFPAIAGFAQTNVGVPAQGDANRQLLSTNGAEAAVESIRPRKLVTLTNAAAVRALTQSEASEHFPVRLRGVVIGEAEPEGESFAMMDQTAGIYLRGPSSLISRIHQGDLVAVEGYSDPGEFAPFVRLQSLQKIGRQQVPLPRKVSFEQLVTGRPDAQWVEVSGVVRSCEAIPSSRKHRLQLATGGGRLSVDVNSPLPMDNLVDAEVRLMGVCYYQVNNTRQVISPLLLVPRDVPVVVESASSRASRRPRSLNPPPRWTPTPNR